jgi:hypothetical protein
MFSVLCVVQLLGLAGVIAYEFAESADPSRDGYVWAGVNGGIAVSVLIARTRVEADAPNIQCVLWACAAAGVWVPLAKYLLSS